MFVFGVYDSVVLTRLSAFVIALSASVSANGPALRLHGSIEPVGRDRLGMGNAPAFVFQ